MRKSHFADETLDGLGNVEVAASEPPARPDPCASKNIQLSSRFRYLRFTHVQTGTLVTSFRSFGVCIGPKSFAKIRQMATKRT